MINAESSDLPYSYLRLRNRSNADMLLLKLIIKNTAYRLQRMNNTYEQYNLCEYCPMANCEN